MQIETTLQKLHSKLLDRAKKYENLSKEHDNNIHLKVYYGAIWISMIESAGCIAEVILESKE